MLANLKSSNIPELVQIHDKIMDHKAKIREASNSEDNNIGRTKQIRLF